MFWLLLLLSWTCLKTISTYSYASKAYCKNTNLHRIHPPSKKSSPFLIITDKPSFYPMEVVVVTFGHIADKKAGFVAFVLSAKTGKNETVGSWIDLKKGVEALSCNSPNDTIVHNQIYSRSIQTEFFKWKAPPYLFEDVRFTAVIVSPSGDFFYENESNYIDNEYEDL